jgi:NADH dehydrogenase FAD-containing subunit
MYCEGETHPRPLLLLLLLLLQDLPGVEVTLVHGGQRLLPSLTPKASAVAEAWLRNKGCKVSQQCTVSS